ncbi:hypothetical protein NBRC3257_2300 [Gluconobacter thailandicus NBRC 3257]|uniref:Uncharacterized protein n=1 Tax=Gluconobacter thailandicus NBRC 3257 TaxID=1381097 RepID=A0ABQ0IYM8_GLUTH|nr:hypothetical protein NBRC3255_0839 [Gluconobacter thailandicus NBRC 3255]GAD27301.1 hypothetical protein NBRC3257_2300 [Gluconobacter thailandicus NBRC 3257]
MRAHLAKTGSLADASPPAHPAGRQLFTTSRIRKRLGHGTGQEFPGLPA